MKIVDTKSYFDVLCQLTETGHTVSTVICGGSMLPFLSDGRDYAFLKKPSSPPKKGDIVLFIRADGNYVLHRIRFIRKGKYYLIGDRQSVTEGPVELSQIMAIVTSVKRKDKIITPKNAIWKFYSKIWINIVPLRRPIFYLRALFGK